MIYSMLPSPSRNRPPLRSFASDSLPTFRRAMLALTVAFVLSSTLNLQNLQAACR
jgi:hypothetical protein